VEEKRRHRRIAYQAEITCRPDGGTAFQATSHDLSLGGMFIESEHNPAFGTQMVVTIVLPGQPRPFDLPCVVRWNKPDGFGVQFGLLGARETHAITRLA
jgi:type IV pilus assembly protein PilZ